MKYITTIWSTLLLITALVLLRVYDPSGFIEQIRLNTFDQYIKTLPQEKSNDIVIVNLSLIHI